MLYREAVASQVLSRWYFKIFYLKIWLFWHQFWKYTQYHCLKLALWKRNIKKSHVAQDFCTVLHINKTWYEKKKKVFPPVVDVSTTKLIELTIYFTGAFSVSQSTFNSTLWRKWKILLRDIMLKKTLVTLICIITNFLPNFLVKSKVRAEFKYNTKKKKESLEQTEPHI